jgi:hypothetical protein
MQGFLTIFYVDNAYFVSRDTVLLQTAPSILAELFECVGLEINCLKIQAVICTPGRIRTQLPTTSYHCICLGCQMSKEWEAHRVTCFHCNTMLQVCSLPRHWQFFAGYTSRLWLQRSCWTNAKALRTKQYSILVVNYSAPSLDAMQCHFQDLNPRDKVIVPKEGQSYP